MNDIISNIMLGVKSFPFFAQLLTLPIIIATYYKYRRLNLVRIGLNYLLIFYLLCVTALVFFPLPDVLQLSGLNGYQAQLVPFMFIADIIKESPFIPFEPSTYIPTLLNRAVWQVIFNVLMTIPFGMFLSYYFKASLKTSVLLTFLLSLSIEIAQLTGLFFIYPGSYRLCDIDDLLLNTLGGLIGFAIIKKLEGRIPDIKCFDIDKLYSSASAPQ